MATPAYQESAFQNFTAHGIKGFQVTDSVPPISGGSGAQMWHHHHAAHGISQDERPVYQEPS